MSDSARCKNWLYPPGARVGFRCTRDTTGDDGLCNICRAAIQRGRRAAKRNEESRRAADERRRAVRDQQRIREDAAAIVEKRHPAIWAAAIDEARRKAAR